MDRAIIDDTDVKNGRGLKMSLPFLRNAAAFHEGHMALFLFVCMCGAHEELDEEGAGLRLLVWTLFACTEEEKRPFGLVSSSSTMTASPPLSYRGAQQHHQYKPLCVSLACMWNAGCPLLCVVCVLY